MSARELIGSVDVDAGLIWVGDPCYVLGEDSSSGPKDWAAMCQAMKKAGAWTGGPGKVTEPLGSGVGMAVPTTWGDGSYPVYVTRDREGRVTSVTVEFDLEVDS